MAESNNQYIPKFIQDVPWYYKTGRNPNPNPSNDNETTYDALSHHRKVPGQQLVDHSEAQPGAGISDATTDINGTKTRTVDDYDAKRDRWHGHDAAEWDRILAQWDLVKNKGKSGSGVYAGQQLGRNDDLDDTDYELELEELGLQRSDIKSGHIEDPLEKTVRDRRDVPAYIMAINSNVGGKIRLGQDSALALLSGDNVFVKESKDVLEFKKVQQFAWEQNREFEATQKKRQYEQQLAGLKNPNAHIETEFDAADLNSGMEANPTLMLVKNREREAAMRQKGEEKKRRLMDMYGL